MPTRRRTTRPRFWRWGLRLSSEGPDGGRSIPADEFFFDLFLTALAPDEIITEVRVPAAEKSAYVKFPHPASRFAVVGCAVCLDRRRGQGGFYGRGQCGLPR